MSGVRVWGIDCIEGYRKSPENEDVTLTKNTATKYRRNQIRSHLFRTSFVRATKVEKLDFIIAANDVHIFAIKACDVATKHIMVVE